MLAVQREKKMKKFETDKDYSTRSVCDYDCIFNFRVIKRTEKSIWIKDIHGNVSRKKIEIYNNEESIYPFGHYSMCPILRAS